MLSLSLKHYFLTSELQPQLKGEGKKNFKHTQNGILGTFYYFIMAD